MTKDVRKQPPEDIPEEEEYPREESEEEEEEELELDKKLDTVFKAISDLQVTIKDLATAISSGSEAQRGLEETMGEFKGEIKELKEYVKAGVGTSAVTEANEEQESQRSKTKEPQTAEGGEEVEVNPKDVDEPAEHLYKSQTPRPVDANNKVEKREDGSDVVKGVLEGKVKPGEIHREIKKRMGVN